MSLFRTLDRTTCTSAASSPRHTRRPVLAFLCPGFYTKSTRRRFRPAAANHAPRLPLPSVEHMESFFIQALVRAGSCPAHAKHISTLRDTIPFSTRHHKTRRRGSAQGVRRDFKSPKTTRAGPLARVGQFARKELEALVDYYGIDFERGVEKDDIQDEGSLIWNIGDDHEPWPVRNPDDALLIDKLEKLLEDEESPHEEVYDTYRLLPRPGVVYLCTKTIRRLLHHLSVVERPSQIHMQRFLSVLDDMKSAHIHISRAEWTSAIYFAGRFMGKVSAHQVQSALYIWRDMEKRAGVKGGPVTFNVLFDVAVKAGKYTLAETFLKEMQARKLKLHRHFRVSLLYYYGVQQNGDRVRRTYKELVEAGDIVDTVVMNAVIAALFRAGEPTAAEHVFERMKRLKATRTSTSFPHTFYKQGTWRERRLLGLHLTHEGRHLTESAELEKWEDLQNTAPIAPNARTYGLLIRYHAATAGNIDRVQELLEEMRYHKIPIQGTIFIVIIYGFSSFGGVRYSSWTRDKLESLWKAYIQSEQDKVDRTWFSSMSVIAALKAFKKCTTAERTMQAWEEVRKVWEPGSEELEAVLQALRRLVPQRGFFDENRRL
ncbi:hypothetical protein BDV95DRAFT_569482 [Massariosphaeria phaeospora]|uniref:Pentatricopeptide repeat protein-like protein n=1 Tax=Massariosphaeria phaeospora TaxID=100035 RepID=A0A7C8IGD2_9PLEO|nr:hypothetical protein BDV95DRAFT_569482 [Massariosphaeria phaeospora]